MPSRKDDFYIIFTNLFIPDLPKSKGALSISAESTSPTTSSLKGCVGISTL